MQRAGGNEGMDTRPFGMFDGFARPVDILVTGACKTRDSRILRNFSDLGNGFEVAIGGYRESCLNNINAHLIEHFGHLEFFLQSHGCAWRLLPVP